MYYLGQSLQKKNLDTLSRQNCAHFLSAQNATKTLSFGNIKASAKSSHHEDFAHVLIFGWFGNVFFVMSVQKLAILVGRSDINFLQSRYRW